MPPDIAYNLERAVVYKPLQSITPFFLYTLTHPEKQIKTATSGYNGNQ
jgi:hypothetical protein